MELRHTVTLVLIACGIIVGMSIFYTELFNTYDVDAEDLTFIDRSNETLQLGAQMSSETQGISFNVITYIFSAPFKVVKMIFSSVGTLNALISDFTTQIGLPLWAFNLITGLILVFVVFGIISVYLKYKV